MSEQSLTNIYIVQQVGTKYYVLYVTQLHEKRAMLHLHCLSVQVERGTNTATWWRNWHQEMESKLGPCDCEWIIIIIIGKGKGKGKGKSHPTTGHEGT